MLKEATLTEIVNHLTKFNESLNQVDISLYIDDDENELNNYMSLVFLMDMGHL